MRFGLNTIARAWRVLVRTLIKLISFIDHRWYMKAYNAYLRWVGVQMDGNVTYLSSNTRLDGADFSLISLGDGVVISSGVRILTHDFSIDRVLKADPNLAEDEVFVARGVRIGTDVFVGAGSILLPGSNIGDRSIIGAGSVVRGEIPPDSLVIGNPAEVVGSALEFAQGYQSETGERRQSLRRIRR